jgi:hypothetical protein
MVGTSHAFPRPTGPSLWGHCWRSVCGMWCACIAQARVLYGLAEFLAPVLKQSQFTEKGVLTPEEFVLAGDNLVYKCPTWEWCVDGTSLRVVCALWTCGMVGGVGLACMSEGPDGGSWSWPRQLQL